MPQRHTPMHIIQACIYPSSTPLSLRLLKSSGSKNLLMVTSSARPFLLRVLSTKSRASCCAVAGSSGRVVMSLSRGSPGTMDQRSKTRERDTWPCVWIWSEVSILTLCSYRSGWCTYPKIGLEAEGIDDRDKTSHVVQWRTRDRSILQDVSSSSCEDCV